ncbi:MAG: hypothetical protein ACC630_01795 [Nitrospinota bacterium]
MNYREQLFLKFATEGLDKLTSETQAKYQPKKGNRFNLSKITYEIGSPKINNGGIEFEVSSKIPQDELQAKEKMEKYFDKIKSIITKGKKKPDSIDMENIVWDADKDTEKKRDYVKLTYCYAFDELYDEKKIIDESEALKNAPSSKLKEVPHIPGIVTIPGKLVLLSIRDSIYEEAKAIIEDFINANTQARKEFKLH